MADFKAVAMQASVSGLRNGAPWPGLGETVSLPADEADALVAAGIAKAVVKESPAKQERAVAPAPETRRRKS